MQPLRDGCGWESTLLSGPLPGPGLSWELLNCSTHPHCAPDLATVTARLSLHVQIEPMLGTPGSCFPCEVTDAASDEVALWIGGWGVVFCHV